MGPLETDGQIIAWPGGRNTGDLFGGVDVHIISVIIAKDINGRVSLIPQILGTPLAHGVGTHCTRWPSQYCVKDRLA